MKKKICKKEYECNKCKAIFNFSFSTFLAFLCLFGENDTLHFTYWVIFLPSGTSAASMTSTASVASMTSIASFHQKTSWVDIFINHDTKMTYPGLLMWDGSLKIHCFVDFWHFFSWRLWRARNIKKIKFYKLGINGPISWTRRIQNTSKNQYLYAQQSRITYHSLLWDTLYKPYHSTKRNGTQFIKIRSVWKSWIWYPSRNHNFSDFHYRQLCY